MCAKARSIEARDLQTIYEAPIAYHAAGLDTELLHHFGVTVAPQPDLAKWDTIVKRLKAPDGEVTIAVVGKYTELKDAYKSLIEALYHGGVANNVKVNLRWVESEKFEETRRRLGTKICTACMAFWCRAASANAAAKAKSPPSPSRANTMRHSSAFASACRWPASRRRATKPA